MMEFLFWFVIFMAGCGFTTFVVYKDCSLRGESLTWAHKIKCSVDEPKPGKKE